MTKSATEVSRNRRDLLRILAGVAAANGLGAAAWGTLEFLLPSRLAASWHKSVCRFCGTGCGIQVGRRDGQWAASKVTRSPAFRAAAARAEGGRPQDRHPQPFYVYPPPLLCRNKH